MKGLCLFLSVLLVVLAIVCDARPAQKNNFLKVLRKRGKAKVAGDGTKAKSRDASKKPIVDLLEMNDKNVKDLATALTPLLGFDVTADDVTGFMDEHEETLEEAIGVAAGVLESAEIDEFDDLLAHPDWLKTILGQLSDKGLLNKKDKDGKGKDKRKKASRDKKSVDDLFEMNDENAKNLAEAVSTLLGFDVTADDVTGFMDEHEETVEEAIGVAAAVLNSAEIDEFDDLLTHPEWLKTVLGHLDDQGLLEKRKK